MTIKKILHIADIHVRNFKRHKEYLEVFKRLFKQIKLIKDDNTIIFLGGDIVHSKTEMTPELISLVTYFLKGCADLCPTILILGNHDTNLKNENRLDALTPIVKAINHENLHYWKESGVYELGNIHFSVFSVLGSTEQWISAKDIQYKGIKIALHHGAVFGSKTDLDHVINNEYVKSELFSGFDYVLLGDIHKRQFLNDGETIHYPGSLIQQDHGETLKKGFTLWNLDTNTSEFIEVENDIGYVTLQCKADKLLTDPAYVKDWPKKLRLRIKHEQCTKEYIHNLIAKIKTKHHIEEISTPKLNSLETLINKSLALDDVRDVEYQNSLITEYINTKSLGHVDADYIRHLNRMINSELNSGIKLIRNIKWKPKTLEFSNMFSYGSNNSINFENIHGIQGVFAANASGKSSLLDIFTYCIYDKCSRAWKAKDILNNKKNKFRCKLELELAGEHYIIERQGFQNKTGSVRVEVDFYKLDIDGNKLLLNGQDRDQTNKLIRDYLGTYDDFLLTTLSTQNDNKNFIFKSQRERKELLYSFLDLSIFEELHNLAKKYIKSKSNSLLYAETDLYSNEYATLDKDELELLNKQSGLEQLLEESKKELNSYQIQLDDFNKQLIPIASECTIFTNTDEQELIKLKSKTAELDSNIQSYNQCISTLNDKISEIQIKLKQPEFENLDTNLQSRIELSDKISEIKTDIINLTTQIEHINLKLQKLNSHEYDPNCEFCVKNEFVQDAKNSEQILPELEMNLNLLENDYKIIYAEYDSTNIYAENKIIVDEFNKKLNQLLQEKNTKNNLLLQYIQEKNNIEASLASLLKIKEQYNQHKDSIEKNNQIKLKTDTVLKAQSAVAKIFSTTQAELTEIKAKLLVIDIKKQKKIQLETTIDTLTHEVSAYNAYIDMTHTDGLPYMILQKILPVIENEVNLILNDVVDFYAKFESDEKCNINCYLLYSNENCWPVEMASGMERFIISLAIRCALVEITNLPRPIFMAIDEGFGTLDSERINSLTPLFDYMRSKFDFIIAVSHVDTMRDMVDGLIDVHKNKNGFSEVVVP